MQHRTRFLNNWNECEKPLGYNMSVFYRLCCSDARFVDLSEGNDWEGVTCPREPGHQRAGCRTTDLHIDIVSKRIADFSSTILGNIVVTDSALKALEKSGLTGFCVKPVVVHGIPKGMDSKAVPELWELSVVGAGGKTHPESGITTICKCDECGLVLYSAYEHGLKIDEYEYDGSDFFTVVEYPTHVFVTEKAKRVIESIGNANVNFIESTKLEWPKGVIKP